MEDQLRFNSHHDLMDIDITILILQRGKLKLREFIEPISHNRGAKRISVCGSFHCINLQQEVSEMSWLRTQPMKSEKNMFNLYWYLSASVLYNVSVYFLRFLVTTNYNLSHRIGYWDSQQNGTKHQLAKLQKGGKNRGHYRVLGAGALGLFLGSIMRHSP